MAVRFVSGHFAQEFMKGPQVAFKRGLHQLPPSGPSGIEKAKLMEQGMKKAKETWQQVQNSKPYYALRCTVSVARGAVFLCGEMAGFMGKMVALTFVSYQIAPVTTMRIIKLINSAPPTSG